MKLNRNSTSFTTQLFEHYKKIVWGDEYSFLKYYQNLVRSYIRDLKVGSRGILVDHGMGLGKSLLGVSIAIDFIKEKEVIMLLTKSLQQNMEGAIRQYVRMRTVAEPDFYLGNLSTEDLNIWIGKNFEFVSMNASNMLKQVNRAAEGKATEDFDAVLEKRFGEIIKLSSLNKKLLIVDEAHNFFRAITNGSKNALGLYDMIMNAEDLVLIFLTGTPIAHDPFEIVPCFNMLGAPGEVVLPENYSEFYKMFVDTKLGVIKNKGKFQNRIIGLVSYVTQMSTPGRAFGITTNGNQAEFPTELPIVVERVNMDPDQYTMYKLARDKEQSEGQGKVHAPRNIPALTKPRSGASSTYRVRSRQLGNFCAPTGMRDEKDPSKIPTNALASAKFRAITKNISKHPKQIGLVYSQFTGIGGLGSFSRYLDSLGWVQYKCPTRGSTEADGPEVPRVDEYLAHIDRELSKTGGDFNLADGYPLADYLVGGDEEKDDDNIDVSQYLSTTGGDFNLADGYPLADYLVGGNNKDAPLVYALITGEVPIEDRAYIQEVCNQIDNMHGGIIDLILVSSTGAEGLDFKNGRHVHVMEMYWDWARVMQVIKRFVRNNSHIGLPESERNVTPYLYLAIPPESERDQSGVYPETTDVELFNKAISSQILNESFIEAIEEVSIECMINAGKNCRNCNPTGEKLYTDDIDRDIRATDPCQSYEEKHLRAEAIVLDGITYHFIPDSESVYDYAVYVFDDEVNKHRRMKESDPRYEKIIESVLKVVGGAHFVIEERTDPCVDTDLALGTFLIADQSEVEQVM